MTTPTGTTWADKVKGVASVKSNTSPSTQMNSTPKQLNQGNKTDLTSMEGDGKSLETSRYTAYTSFENELKAFTGC